MKSLILMACLALCGFGTRANEFYDRVFNYRSRKDCFVAITVYKGSDTVKYVVENHALYDYMAGGNKANLEYSQYKAAMTSTLEKKQGITVNISLDDLQKKWHFHRVEISSDIAAQGKDAFIKRFFYGGVLNGGLSRQNQDAIIYLFFQWNVAMLTDDETGDLIILDMLTPHYTK